MTRVVDPDRCPVWAGPEHFQSADSLIFVLLSLISSISCFVTIPRFSIRIELWSFGQHEREKAWTGAGDRPILAASMPVRAIQKKWATLRAVLFPWEIGGYMAAARF
jgi:hypothetical protein